MHYIKAKLVENRYLLPFILVTSLFFLWGFAHAILDVLNKHFQLAFSIEKAESALIQATMYMGYFTMALPAGIFISRYGYRRGVVFGLLLYGIGSLLFIPGQLIMSFPFFLFSLFIIGCGLTFLETSANPYVTELGAKETAASRLNLAQSFNGLGCIFAPLLTGLVLFPHGGESGSGNIAIPYGIMGILVVLVAIIFAFVRLPEINHRSDEESDGRSLFKHSYFLFGWLALFAYEISEISINSFFINYMVDDRWLSERDAAMVLSFGGLSLFMVGRFLGSWLMRMVRAEAMLFYCALGTVVTTTLVIMDIDYISVGALFLGYAFEAIMFPTIFALSLRGLGNLTKIASSFLMMTPVGGVIGPLLMGYVADCAGMAFSFIIPWIGYFTVLLYAALLKRKKVPDSSVS